MSGTLEREVISVLRVDKGDYHMLTQELREQIRRAYYLDHKHEVPDVFIPLEFEPGQDAQCDWGEAIAVIGGIRQAEGFTSFQISVSVLETGFARIG